VTAKYRLVFFDVDSTLVTIEGIDVLGEGNVEVAKLTDAAMNGKIPLEEIYERRLQMIRPTRAAIDALAGRYVDCVVEGGQETIAALHDAGAVVHLVTAGIEQAILPLARHLAIDPRRVHAVRVRFKASGEYEDFDRHSPLTRQHGKELVVRDVRARAHGTAAFVGDGASDLEAKPAVDLFIGFGGVHTRPVVKDNADVFVDDRRLTAILPYLMA
jgi:phosphoserine phosphatase